MQLPVFSMFCNKTQFALMSTDYRDISFLLSDMRLKLYHILPTFVGNILFFDIVHCLIDGFVVIYWTLSGLRHNILSGNKILRSTLMYCHPKIWIAGTKPGISLYEMKMGLKIRIGKMKVWKIYISLVNIGLICFFLFHLHLEKVCLFLYFASLYLRHWIEMSSYLFGFPVLVWDWGRKNICPNYTKSGIN